MNHNKSAALKEQARQQARTILAQSNSFRELNKSEQFSLYKDIVDSTYEELARQHGHNPAGGGTTARAMATADQLIDDSRATREQDAAADRARRMIQTLGPRFVDFVSGLLNGVYDANLEANNKQMEAFSTMLKKTTRSLSAFVNEIDDADAQYFLAENFPGQFRLGAGGRRRQRLGSGNRAGNSRQQAESILVDNEGRPVKLDDEAVKAKLMDAKLQMAKERRALLRETLLMGVSRMVVTDGKIRANLSFKLDTDTYVERESEVAAEDRTTGIGFKGFQIRVNSTTSQSQAYSGGSETVSSSASMDGHVEINFKSDYFKLDNFARMYGADLEEGKQEASESPEA
ncbi:MAG: hypothetical protein KDC66_17350 [Phaeodactylibacter sp.]|nr:hypothetical protein [Phaeodactylibacter sp.]